MNTTVRTIKPKPEGHEPSESCCENETQGNKRRSVTIGEELATYRHEKNAADGVDDEKSVARGDGRDRFM